MKKRVLAVLLVFAFMVQILGITAFAEEEFAENVDSGFSVMSVAAPSGSELTGKLLINYTLDAKGAIVMGDKLSVDVAGLAANSMLSLRAFLNDDSDSPADANMAYLNQYKADAEGKFAGSFAVKNALTANDAVTVWINKVKFATVKATAAAAVEVNAGFGKNINSDDGGASQTVWCAIDGFVKGGAILVTYKAAGTSTVVTLADWSKNSAVSPWDGTPDNGQVVGPLYRVDDGAWTFTGNAYGYAQPVWKINGVVTVYYLNASGTIVAQKALTVSAGSDVDPVKDLTVTAIALNPAAPIVKIGVGTLAVSVNGDVAITTIPASANCVVKSSNAAVLNAAYNPGTGMIQYSAYKSGSAVLTISWDVAGVTQSAKFAVKVNP